MFRPYLVVLFLTTLIVSCTSFVQEDIESKLVFNSKAYVKKVEGVLGGHCSSVFVMYKGEVRHLTNAHCCEVPMLYNGKEAKFKKVDVAVDLCELEHNDFPERGLNISQDAPEITNIVYSVGYSGTYSLNISQGRVVTGLFISPLNGQFLYGTTAFTIRGNSGGAALDRKGDLFGIISQANGLNHGSFIPAIIIRAFLN